MANPMNKPVHIIIMEPDNFLLFSVSSFIREHYASRIIDITEVKTLFELRQAMMKNHFDVILTALHGEGEYLSNWWEFEGLLNRFWPNTPCLAWSEIPPPYLQCFNQSRPATCYIQKTLPLAVLSGLLETVLAGGAPAVLRELSVPPLPNVILTRHELDVVQRLCQGESLKGIAWALERSIKTISAHKCNAMRKLGVRSTAMLLKMQKSFMTSKGRECN